MTVDNTPLAASRLPALLALLAFASVAACAEDGPSEPPCTDPEDAQCDTIPGMTSQPGLPVTFHT